jgi:DNA-directed RNA polymerase specialized sigma subunit
VFEEKTQKEVAKELHLSQQAIQKRLKKITEILGGE